MTQIRAHACHLPQSCFRWYVQMKAALQGRSALILDGAMATELERVHGMDLGSDHLWSAKALHSSPQAIKQVHRSYLEAGADIITTCSYQASVPGFVKAGFSTVEAEELMRRSVRLAVETRDEFWAERQQAQAASHKGPHTKPLVAASLGCYGAMLADGSEYSGSYSDTVSHGALRAFHAERLQVLAAEPGIDVLAFETLPCAKEVAAICDLLASGEAPSLPAWIAVSCSNERNCVHGETLEQCFQPALGVEQVEAVGVNCTPPQLCGTLMQCLGSWLAASGVSKLQVCYPNAGEQYDPAKKQWIGGTGSDAAAFAEAAAGWHTCGAKVIGGCCRTSPDCIAALRHALT